MDSDLKTIATIVSSDESADFPPARICSLLTDSRSYASEPNTLFIALHTPQRDGHQFIGELFDKGVKNFIIDHPVPEMDHMRAGGANFIKVNDTLQALQQIGSSARESFKQPVIAITGSRGKTTVKEWLKELLADDYNIASSPRSYNSQIGVPLSLWEINENTDLGIFEAGISRPGEMARLNAILHPEIAIITNVGTEHIESFRDRYHIAEEKALLAKSSRYVIYDQDDQAVSKAVNNSTEKDQILIGYSTLNTHAPLFISIKKGENDSKLTYSFQQGTTQELTVPFISDWHLQNVLTALATMLVLGIKPEVIKERIAELKPVRTRMEVLEGVNECELIHDSYQADVPSLLPALDFAKRRLSSDKSLTIILSDLNHDKTNPKALYKNVMRMLTSAGVERFIGIGQEMVTIAKGLMPAQIEAEFYSTTEAFINQVSGSDFLHELILIKGTSDYDLDPVIDMLQAQQHETVMEVNLDAVVSNYNFFRSKLKQTTGIVCMLKASGYGAGSLELARTMQSQGAAYLAVAVHDEGVELRDAGITMPIIVLNPKVENFKSLFRHHLEPEIYSFEFLERLIQEAKRCGVKNYPIHLKLDTGMHRLGFLEKDIPGLIEILSNQDEVKPRSIFSHLCVADDPQEDDYTRQQFEYFERCSKAIQKAFPYHILRHILNSTGITRFPEHQYDMVRLGIGLYGIKTMHDGSQDGLRPVSTVKSPVISLKTWPAGTTIGYNRRGVLERETHVATIPIGYADGLNRHLGYGQFSVMLHGVRCPIIGTICMDACMIDVTDVKDVKVGDNVEIFGNQIPVEELSDLLETIPYEILTSISTRIKRVYYRE